MTAATTVLGTEVSFPVLVAPMAFQGLAHPDGERAMARGAAAAGTVMCLSTLSTVEPRGGSRSGSRRRPLVPALLGPGPVASCRTSSSGPQPPATARSWSPSTYRSSAAASAICGRASRHRRRSATCTDNSLTWRDLEWLRAQTTLPILVKGILTAEDAALATRGGRGGHRRLEPRRPPARRRRRVARCAAGGRRGRRRPGRDPPRRRHPARDRRRQGARARRSGGARRPGGALRPRGRTAPTAWSGCSDCCARRSSSRSRSAAARRRHDVTRGLPTSVAFSPRRATRSREAGKPSWRANLNEERGQ